MSEQLVEWFRSNGGEVHPAVEIAHDEVHGYHLLARDRLDISKPVVYCPRAVTLSVQDVIRASSQWPQPFISRFQDASPEVLVRFLLLHEFIKGSCSRWWPYIATLPSPDDTGASSLDTPLWFSERDKLWVKGTNIEAAIRERESLWYKEFREGCNLLQGTVDVTKYTWHLYRWAATILSSRCFPEGKPSESGDHAPISSVMCESHQLVSTRSPVLCPVLDIANHKHSAHAVWLIDDKGYTLLTEDPAPPGTQIFNNYGPKGNEELLMGYGFTVPNNPYDVFGLSLSFPDTPQKSWAQKIVEEGGKLPSRMSKLLLDRPRTSNQPGSNAGGSSATFFLAVDGHISETLLDLLSLMVANERELRKWGQNALGAFVPQQRTLVQGTAHLRKVVIERHRKLSMASRDLPAEPANDRQRHALLYRNGQRNILKTHLTQLSKDLLHRIQAPQVVTIDDIMTSAPASVRVDIRTALRTALGTRNPVRLKEQGHQDVVFVLFICLVWMTFSHGLEDCGSDSESTSSASTETSTSSSSEVLEPFLHRWHTFIGQNYCPPPGCPSREADYICKCINCFCSPKSPPTPNEQKPWTILPSEDEQAEDEQTATMVYSIVQRASLLGSFDSTFRDEGWTKEFIRWAVGIWRAEAVLLPASILARLREDDDSSEEVWVVDGETGHDEEERVLFLEVDATVDGGKKGAQKPPRKKRKFEE